MRWMWRVACWVASKQLGDPCKWKVHLWSDKRFKLIVARTSAPEW